MPAPVIARRGLRFLHLRILDSAALDRGERKPALCEVTAVRRGEVYYRPVAGGASERASTGRFAEIAMPTDEP